MAATRISDVIVPEYFAQYITEQTKETSILFTSGVVAPNALVQAGMATGGDTFTLPFWNDLSGDEDISGDDPAVAATPGKVTANKQTGVALRRNKSFSSTDLAAALAGDDPMGVVGRQITNYWNRRLQAAMIATATGALAELGADGLLDISGGVGAAAVISGDAVIDARGTLGDAADDVGIIAIHSKVYQLLQKQNLIDFEQISEQGEAIPRYLGMRVIQSDAMPNAAGVYTSMLFGNGAFAYGETPAKVPVAIDRDELGASGGGVEFFVSRRDFALHPVGFKWVGTPAGDTPTNAELLAGANWTRVFERKNVAMAGLKHKIA